jgi:hypothetical protein
MRKFAVEFAQCLLQTDGGGLLLLEANPIASHFGPFLSARFKGTAQLRLISRDARCLLQRFARTIERVRHARFSGMGLQLSQQLGGPLLGVYGRGLYLWGGAQSRGPKQGAQAESGEPRPELAAVGRAGLDPEVWCRHGAEKPRSAARVKQPLCRRRANARGRRGKRFGAPAA